ncbi:hypothetical protein ACOU9P_002091 [Enterococcus faecium]|nr:hypothetical protein [Enterococcus faecium]
MLYKINVSLKMYLKRKFSKIIGSKFYVKFFDKQTESRILNKFLKNVASGKYTENKNIRYAYLDNDDHLNAIFLAIEKGYVSNIEILEREEEIFPELEAVYPTVTVSGENFLRNQSFFNRHPFFEKVLIAVISSIVTLLIGYFSK